MKTMWRCLACVLFLSVASMADQFEKIGFLDPYQVLNGRSDTSGLACDSYYGQLYSLGITKITATTADSTSTNNAFGIGIMGDDDKIEVNDDIKGLMHKLHVANNLYIQPEKNDTLLPYNWLIREGEAFPENSPDGWLCCPNEHDTGLVLKCQTVFKYPHPAYLSPTMKVWDTSLTDTICRINLGMGSGGTWDYYDYYFTGQDFDLPGEWKTFEDLYIDSLPLTVNSVYMSVYWYGQDSLAFESFSLLDTFGMELEAATDSAIQEALEDYYARINTNNHARFYLEEPYPSQYYGLERLVDCCADVPPYHRLNSGIPYFHTAKYIYNIDPQEVLSFHYSVQAWHDSASVSDITSIQNAYDAFIEKITETGMTCRAQSVPLWWGTQCGCSYSIDAAGKSIYLWRDLSDSEFRTLINLIVAYGASGIMYFPYTTLYLSSEYYTPPNLDIKICKSIPPQIPDTMIMFRGLVDWDQYDRRYVPNSKWYVAQDAHQVIDSLWPILEGNWKGADNWKNVTAIDGSIIDTIYSTTFSPDSTYLEVARFNNGSDDYYMLINRRTKSTDGQNVVIQINDAPGTIEFYDPYNDESTIVFDSCGMVQYTTHFNPGEMKLLRIGEKLWVGPVEGTWPTFSTCRINGIVTIYPDDTLVVQIGAKVMAIAGVGGEISVGGHLEVNGNASESALFTSTTSQSNTWDGIRVTGAGSANIQYARIENAYIGIKIENDSTAVDSSYIQHTHLDNCHAYGLHVKGDDIYISNVTIDSSLNAVGMKFDNSNCVASNCTIENAKFGIFTYNAAPRLESIFLWDIDDYAIRLNNSAESDTVVMEDCWIENAENGVIVGGDQTRALITGSTNPFLQASSYIINISDYGILNIFANSFVAVENTEIVMDESETNYGVYCNGGNVDLGGGGVSTGYNAFDYAWTSPDYYIYNTGTGVARADSCCFQYTYNLNYCIHDWDSTVLSTGWRACRQLQLKADAVSGQQALPDEFNISQNFPNPFNPVTSMEYSLPTAGYVRIVIYNILGQVIRSLVDCEQEAGYYTIIWDGKDRSGREVATGVYFYQMRAGDFVSSKKMVVLK